MGGRQEPGARLTTSGRGAALTAGGTATGPVADVEHEADDHEGPAPTAQPVADRVVGEDVEQGRVGEDDQPEQREDETVEGAVHQVREDPDQDQGDPGCEPGKQCEQ